MSSLPEEALLAGFGAGDPDAVAAFVRRFQGRVYGLALRMAGDPNVAEEVAQETFIRAWRYARGYDSRRGEVTTWLLAITRNLALDARRGRSVELIDPDTILTLPLAEREPGPEERVFVRRASDPLRDAIASLPREQRRAVVLAALGGHTAQEISESEGVPVGTAKTRIRSGLLKLRSALEVAHER